MNCSGTVPESQNNKNVNNKLFMSSIDKYDALETIGCKYVLYQPKNYKNETIRIALSEHITQSK